MLIKSGCVDTDTHAGSVPCELEGRIRVMLSASQGTLQIVSKGPEVREQAWSRSFWRHLQRERDLLTRLSQTPRFQNCETTHFCCVSHPVCGTRYCSNSHRWWGALWYLWVPRWSLGGRGRTGGLGSAYSYQQVCKHVSTLPISLAVPWHTADYQTRAEEVGGLTVSDLQTCIRRGEKNILLEKWRTHLPQ